MKVMRGGWMVALILLTMGGCAGDRQSVIEEIADTGGGQFRYTTSATMLHPLNSAQAEQHRLRRLDELLRARGLCPNGYEILGRAAASGHRLGGSEYDVRDVTYIGQCR